VTAISLPAARRLDVRQTRRIAAVGLAVAAVLLYLVFRGTGTLPHDEESSVFAFFNQLRDAIDASRATNPIFLYIIDPLRQVIDQIVKFTLETLHSMGPVGVIGVAGVIGFLVGGWPLALLAITGFLSLGALGLWDESLDTLGLTLAAVALSLLVGIPLGILAGRNDSFQRFVNPISKKRERFSVYFSNLFIVALLVVVLVTGRVDRIEMREAIQNRYRRETGIDRIDKTAVFGA
jgi:glycine betaine/proline transport system permease protein